MGSKSDRIRDWWWNFHQRGVFTHCRGVFVWCFVDNITHVVYVQRLVLRRRTGWRWICPTVPLQDSWLARKHDQAAYRGHLRIEHAARARRIRKLGWGT